MEILLPEVSMAAYILVNAWHTPDVQVASPLLWEHLDPRGHCAPLPCAKTMGAQIGRAAKARRLVRVQ